MSASEHLQPKLFHGTGAPIGTGEVVKPHFNPGAGKDVSFATTDPEEALEYAYSGMLANRTLFGSVLEVEPLDPNEDIYIDAHSPTFGVSSKGFKIKGVHKYVTRND